VIDSIEMIFFVGRSIGNTVSSVKEILTECRTHRGHDTMMAGGFNALQLAAEYVSNADTIGIALGFIPVINP